VPRLNGMIWNKEPYNIEFCNNPNLFYRHCDFSARLKKKQSPQNTYTISKSSLKKLRRLLHAYTRMQTFVRNDEIKKDTTRHCDFSAWMKKRQSPQHTYIILKRIDKKFHIDCFTLTHKAKLRSQ